MKDKGTKGNQTQDAAAENEFRGYTLDELKYQRAILLLKKEFLKEKALKEVNTVKQRIPMLNGKSPLDTITPKGVMAKIINGLNYADYLLLGFSLFKFGKKLTSVFRRKK